MPLQTITSAQALAQGALAAGVKVVTSYPGSPSSETVECADRASGAARAPRRVVEQREGGHGDRHRRLDRRPPGSGLHQERRHERDGRPAHGAEPDSRARRAGHPSGRRSRRLRLTERPGHPPARHDARNAHDGARDARRGLRHDAGGLRRLRAIPHGRDRARDAQLHPADRAGRHSPTARIGSPIWGSLREPWRFVPVPSNVVQKHRELHERLAALERWADRRTL